MRHILNRWRTEKECEHGRGVLGKYLLKMMGLKASDVFRKWKKLYMVKKAYRGRNLKEDYIKEYAKTLAINKVRLRNIAELSKMVRIMFTSNESLRRKVEEQKAILNEPARQTETLKKILKCLGSALRAVESTLKSTTRDSIDEVTSIGDHNIRLAPVYNFSSATTEKLPFNTFEKEDEYDEEIEKKISKWRPGRLKSKGE